jgi:PAS domain S-box-containing protein
MDSVFIVALVAQAAFIVVYYYMYLRRRIDYDDVSKFDGTNYTGNQTSDEPKNKETTMLSIVACQTENAIMIMDAEGNIEWVNEGFTRMYGYTLDEFVKKLGSNIRQTSFSNQIEERLYKCTKLGEPVFYEALNITKSGAEIWTHTSLTPIYDESGELVYLAAIDSDISKRKESGDELLKAIEALSMSLNSLAEHQKSLVSCIESMSQDIDLSGSLLDRSVPVVKFIHEVSDKVKILGLNASIEAANIGVNGNGHSGSGFRIISGEIIRLSDDSKRQAHLIAEAMEGLTTTFYHVEERRKIMDHVAGMFFRGLTEVRRELLRVERVADRLNS